MPLPPEEVSGLSLFYYQLALTFNTQFPSNLSILCDLNVNDSLWRTKGLFTYGQTLRGETYGPMKMQNCPKSVLSAFTLEAEVQRMSPPKKPTWQHFRKLWRQEFRLLSQVWVKQNARPKVLSRGRTFFGGQLF